jgi:hypothetical protein
MNSSGVVLEAHNPLSNHVTEWARDGVLGPVVSKMLLFNVLPRFARATEAEELSLKIRDLQIT